MLFFVLSPYFSTILDASHGASESTHKANQYRAGSYFEVGIAEEKRFVCGPAENSRDVQDGQFAELGWVPILAGNNTPKSSYFGCLEAGDAELFMRVVVGGIIDSNNSVI